jgi:molybdopterin-containing oxidoreductase family iron-sulfur binding subunit
MEKCSFCVQRIEKGKITARNENRALADGEVQSACMQACPTQAIVFGDLSDPQSRVSQLHKAETYRRGYALLAELNTIPRNRYLARVKNPNPVLSPPPPPPAEEQAEHAAPAKQQAHEEHH